MLRTICIVLGAFAAGSALAQAPAQNHAGGAVQSGTSYQNDTSLPLYYLPAWQGDKNETGEAREAAENPRIPNHHVDSRDPVIQNTMSRTLQMPAPILNFDGVDATGSGCGCLPPDTDGQVGDTQYLQMVNMAFQIFDKTTGASLIPPKQISAVWAGFGGACETGGFGDPIVLYDQLANRWLISQFASATGGTPITDECIAVSVTSDATGAYNRYGFHLSSNFIDYPHLGMWPDAYYMSTNVFNASGTAYLGPQPWAFDRAAMIAGTPATFVTTGVISSNDAPILPANLDGQTLPALGAPEPFVEFPGNSPATYQVFHFHPDFVTPANTTFTLVGSPAAAGFTQACTGGRSCVPEVGGEGLDGIGDRLMFRLAYRNFGDHEALVGNYTVSANSVTGERWFELRNVTGTTPTVFQEGTYAPDTDWRWMGSTAMDTVGNIAVGYSASSATIHPQLRYAGRLAGDPVGTLPQAEVHLFDGPGSQNSGSSRWGDYSDLTVDPVDDCTFWYTNEYVDAGGNWKTRIGNFKFPNCSLTPGFTISATPAAASACAGTPATFTVNVGSTAGFQSPVTLAASGNPPPSTATLVPPIVATLPGSSTLTIGNTTGVAAGVYPITVNGTATGASPQSAIANLSIFAAVPGAPTLTAPANAAMNQPARPIFSWTGSNTETYTIDVATDPGFTTIVFTQSVTGTTVTSNVDLVSNTQFYWRVTPANACGNGSASPTFTFTTAPLPGDCSAGTTAQTVYSYGFESGLNGWTLGAGGSGTNTWSDDTTTFHSGAHSWHATEIGTASDQRFVSPPIVLPSGQLPLTLQFWTKRNLEPNPPGCYDGGILEASTDAGTTWTQISSASMLTDPYTGLISSSFQNPLGGLQGWCGNVDWHNSIVDVAAYAGQTAQFRYRLGTDSSVPEPGWWLDDVKVQSCSSSTTQHTVTPSAGANGSIAPSTPVQVNDGSTTSFTLTPAPGYTSGPVTGSCGGTLAGNVFTTAPVTADCTVDAAFTQVAAGDVGISISDGRAYAQYGKALTYTVTVSNPTLTPISGVSVSDVFPAQLNISQANWTCLGGAGVTCTASGTGALSDSGVTVPAAGSVSYLVTAPVQPDAAGGDVVYTVTVTSAGDPNPANNTASDDDVLVLFRSGFDPGNDGGNSPGH